MIIQLKPMIINLKSHIKLLNTK